MKQREKPRAHRCPREYKRKHGKPNAAMSWMMKRSNYVYACLQGNRVVTRSYEHLVGAYGVVGFSGVKDARRAFSLPTLQRRPAHHARIRRSMDKPWTN